MLQKNFIQKQLQSLRTSFFFISLSFSCSLLFIMFTSSTILDSVPEIAFSPTDDDSFITIITCWENPSDYETIVKKTPKPNFNSDNFEVKKDDLVEKNNFKPEDNSNNLNPEDSPNELKPKVPEEKVVLEDIIMDSKSLSDPPFYIGGENAKDKYFDKKLVFTELALDYQIQGKIHISFIVEKDGSISNVKVLGGEKLGYGLDEIAIQAVKNMPKWEPGKFKNKKVRTLCTMPIIFELGSD